MTCDQALNHYAWIGLESMILHVIYLIITICDLFESFSTLYLYQTEPNSITTHC
jgi:hypothetical protein